MQTATHKRNVLDTALALLRGIVQDDQWITVHPNGPDAVGRPALIDESGTIKAGMGGKFNGRSIDDVPRGKNPHPVKEEKYQARQKRMAEKQAAKGGLQEGHKTFPKRHAIKGEVEEMGHKYYVVDNPLYVKGMELREKLGEKQFKKQAPATCRTWSKMASKS